MENQDPIPKCQMGILANLRFALGNQDPKPHEEHAFPRRHHVMDYVIQPLQVLPHHHPRQQTLTSCPQPSCRRPLRASRVSKRLRLRADSGTRGKKYRDKEQED
jgi:hypothetical protein